MPRLGNNGNVLGSTAVFGTPYYGERVLGQLVYGAPRSEARARERPRTAQSYSARRGLALFTQGTFLTVC